MKKKLIAVLLLGVALAPGASLEACLWDYDTMRRARSALPRTRHLISGRFLRYSPEFYRWRIRDRERRLAEKPGQLDLLDDLAVAHDKLGNSRRAIEIMLEKERLEPGLYTTHANLGTFYIHAGELEKGLVHIRRAIEINPDAHFGREIVQQRLVEYLLSREVGWPPALPLDSNPVGSGFREFLENHEGEEVALEDAIRGIRGMMLFGRHDSPILLEALGDLLDFSPNKGRAYLKASYKVEDEAARAFYREKAGWGLGPDMRLLPEGPPSNQLEDLEATLQKELREARTYVSHIFKIQRDRIASRKNPEEDSFYQRLEQEPYRVREPTLGDRILEILTLRGLISDPRLTIVFLLTAWLIGNRLKRQRKWRRQRLEERERRAVEAGTNENLDPWES